MILKRLLVSLLLQSFLLSTNLSLAQSERGFAISLYRAGEYESSIVELKRWIYFNQDDPFVPYARYLLALSQGRMGQYAKAASTLHGLIDSISGQERDGYYGELICESHLQLLNLHFRERRFRDFEIENDRFAAACSDPDPRLSAGAQSMAVAIHVYDLNWDEALKALGTANLLDRETSETLERGINEMNQHSPKSPVLGGMLAIIPGLGHLYAGRGVDGLRSFLINAAGIGLTVFCFVMGMPVFGVLFGVIETALYLSNIYGGVNAVMQQNARFIVDRRDELLKILTVPPLDVITLREELYGP